MTYHTIHNQIGFMTYSKVFEYKHGIQASIDATGLTIVDNCIKAMYKESVFIPFELIKKLHKYLRNKKSIIFFDANLDIEWGTIVTRYQYNSDQPTEFQARSITTSYHTELSENNIDEHLHCKIQELLNIITGMETLDCISLWNDCINYVEALCDDNNRNIIAINHKPNYDNVTYTCEIKYDFGLIGTIDIDYVPTENIFKLLYKLYIPIQYNDDVMPPIFINNNNLVLTEYMSKLWGTKIIRNDYNYRMKHITMTIDDKNEILPTVEHIVNVLNCNVEYIVQNANTNNFSSISKSKTIIYQIDDNISIKILSNRYGTGTQILLGFIMQEYFINVWNNTMKKQQTLMGESFTSKWGSAISGDPMRFKSYHIEANSIESGMFMAEQYVQHKILPFINKLKESKE